MAEGDEVGELVVEVIAEAVAERVAGLLVERMAERRELVSAADVARRYGLSRAWVYEHAEELGVLRVGNGERPRLRFELSAIDRLLSSKVVSDRKDETRPKPRSRSRRQAVSGAIALLLPIGPRRA